MILEVHFTPEMAGRGQPLQHSGVLAVGGLDIRTLWNCEQGFEYQVAMPSSGQQFVGHRMHAGDSSKSPDRPDLAANTTPHLSRGGTS